MALSYMVFKRHGYQTYTVDRYCGKKGANYAFSYTGLYRTRYFTVSGIIGTKEFVSQVYQTLKGDF